MDYPFEDEMPPVRLEFHREIFNTFDKDKAVSFYEWYMGSMLRRIDRLRRFAENNGLEWAGFDPSGLAPFGRWLQGQVKSRALTDAEKATKLSETPALMHLWLSPETYTDSFHWLCVDAGSYYCEIERRTWPRLRWELCLKPPRDASLYEPVLAGYKHKIKAAALGMIASLMWKHQHRGIDVGEELDRGFRQSAELADY